MFKSINGGQLPQRATKYSAGFDVYSNEDVVIGAGETKLVGLGIALDDYEIWETMNYALNNTRLNEIVKHPMYGLATEEDMSIFLQEHYFALHIRSSLRAKGLTSLGTGIIDMDFVYPNEIKMVIHNPVAKHELASIVSKIDMAIENRNSKDNLKIIYNLSPLSKYEIKKGDKIGQLILCRHEGWLLPSEYTKDEERMGGFGSSGSR